MVTERDLNVLVSNVINETSYSHCRLCLRNIHDEYYRFEDDVCLAQHNEESQSQPLIDVLTELLGSDEICEQIPGIDAVCAECANMAVAYNRFLKRCKESNAWLNKIFNNLNSTLNINVENSADKSMYVVLDDDDTKIIFLQNNTDKKKKHCFNTRHKTFKCVECEKYFANYPELRVHNVVEHGSVTCERCHETFANEDEQELHVKSCYNHNCPECLQPHRSADSLKRHQDKVHSVYICKDCGKSCRGLDRLQVHEEKHKAIKNECPKCGKSYLTKDCFTKHVSLCLEDRIEPHPYRAKLEKTYSCEKCSKAYSTPGGLRVHERFIHGNCKPHVCKQCGKQFTAPSYLKIHMVRHTKERNFKCNLCGNRFVSKEALLYHTRRHTGERPYSCKMCSEKFVNASARAEHFKFKHAAPKLTCDVCSRKFFTASFLKKHMSRHQNPSSKLYSGRSMIPPNMPGEQNMRFKTVEITISN